MTNAIEIRRAASSDLDRIVSIEGASFGTEAFSRRQLRYLVTQAQGACFVAVTAERIVGYVSLLARSRYANLRLYSVAVAPEARGLGIGQALLDRSVAYARECGLCEISLEVSVANTAAQALYRKNGFAYTRRLPDYYHDGDGWRMIRPI